MQIIKDSPVEFSNDPSAVNETQTIFRADPITLQTEDAENDGGEQPVRQSSLQMKKPSVDFNAQGLNFHNKKTTVADGTSQAKDKKKSKGILWNMAAGLRKMVTNRLKSGAALS